MLLKYPETDHLPFSQQKHKDDKEHRDPFWFVGKEIVITEKLDGGTCLLFGGKVFARSITEETRCRSFDYIKSNHLYKTLGRSNLYIYGENLYAKHSIGYDKLTDFFFVFSILDNENLFIEWDNVVNWCRRLCFKSVPVLFRGAFNQISKIKDWMENEIKKPSIFGEEREGFVIRVTGSFPYNKHSLNTAKFVRANHIQTNEHWSRRWKPNELLKE